MPTQGELKNQDYFSVASPDVGLGAIYTLALGVHSFSVLLKCSMWWLDPKFGRQTALGSSTSTAIYQLCYLSKSLNLSVP